MTDIVAPSLPVTIRGAETHDINAIVAMGGRFIESTVYKGLIADNPAQRATTILQLIESPNGIIYVAERSDFDLVGFIAMFIFVHPMSGQLIAAEAAWWVEPGARGRVGPLLLSAGESWARANHAELLQMVAPTVEVEHLYERRGFIAVERQYQRSLL